MKTTVWTLASDDDNGTQAGVFATRHEAEEAYFAAIFEDEGPTTQREARKALDAGDYDELHNIAETYLEGGLDSYSIDSQTIETRETETRAVIVIEGGLVQTVIANTAFSYAVIDYDTDGADEDEIKLIPQGEQVVGATGHTAGTYVDATRAKELYDAIACASPADRAPNVGECVPVDELQAERDALPKDYSELTTKWTAYPEAGGFFALISGVLCVTPMDENGLMDASDPMEVDFDGIDPEDATRARRIEIELKAKTPPSDPENMNDERARGAGNTLGYFTKHHGENEQGLEAQNLTDLLCNLAHYCDRNGLNLMKCLQSASMHYATETDSKGTQFDS